MCKYFAWLLFCLKKTISNLRPPSKNGHLIQWAMKPGLDSKNSSSIWDFDASTFEWPVFSSGIRLKILNKKLPFAAKKRGKKLVECELGRDIIYLDDAQCRDNRWMPALNCEARERDREREERRGDEKDRKKR